MRRKVFLTKVLALSVVAAIALAGCSDKGTAEEGSTAVEKVVESGNSEAKSEDSKTDDSKSEDSKTEDSKAEEAATKDSKSEESKSGELATQESKTDGLNANAGNGGNVLEVSDWSAHYKEFFQNYTMEGKKMAFHFEGEESGMYLVFDMNIGAKDKKSIFEFSMSAQDGKVYSMCMYSLEDKSAYLEMDLGDAGKSLYKTDSVQDGAVDSMNMAGDYINTDDLEKLNYVGEETINGVLYDVLVMKQQIEDNKEAEMLYYVNRGAQELELIKMNGVEGLVVKGRISPLESIPLPAGYESAEALDSESFAQKMASGMFTIILSAVGMGSN